jgi:hypothetical protein
MEPSIEYQANPSPTNDNGLSIAFGNCGHRISFDCIQRWLKTVSVPLQQRMGFQQNVSILREHWLYHGRRHHLLHLFQVQIHFILFGMPILPLIAIAMLLLLRLPCIVSRTRVE